jgi:hypothetical protein
VHSLVWVVIVVAVTRFATFVIPALVALIKSKKDDIPEVVRGLAGWLHRSPAAPPQTIRRPDPRRLGAGTGPPRRQDSIRRPSGRSAARRPQRRRAKR